MNLGCVENSSKFKINEGNNFFRCYIIYFSYQTVPDLREKSVFRFLVAVQIKYKATLKLSALDKFLIFTDLFGIADKFIWLFVRKRCYR